MFKNVSINSTNAMIAGGIGRCEVQSNSNALHIYPTNIYVHGPAIQTNDYANNRRGTITAYVKNANNIPSTWYYKESVTVIGSNTCKYGEQKNPEAFGMTFANSNNQYIDSKALSDKKKWVFSNTGTYGKFSFGSSTLEKQHKAQCVLTASTPGMSGENYNWYVSKDKITWVQQSSTTDENGNTVDTPCNPFRLPYQDYDQYVYAELVDGTSGTDYVTVPALRATAVMTKSTDGKTYTVTVSNTIWKNNDNLTITYQWMLNGSNKGTGSSFTLSKALTVTDKLFCRVTVKSGDVTLLDKDLFTSIVVYLDPAKEHSTDDTAEDKRISDATWGYSPEKPMLTWKGAYSKLEEKASWNENVIVLMSTSSNTLTCGTDGFNVVGVDQGNTFDKDKWAKAQQSPLFRRNATITGKWNDKEYTNAIIEITGANNGLLIWGDTRFENLTFKQTGNNDYAILYCQYNNLEMGKNIKMEKFQQTPGYGGINGATVTSFQIFGGICNDGRFWPLNTKDNIKAMENAMPHGKEGFSITLKSGHYSTICVGGRQSNTGNHNGVMGTPNMPIKCTVTMDIDREYNEAHNANVAHYDAGAILAGNHEGAMYADVDIIIRSGKVGRVVNGTLGTQRNFSFTYNGTTYNPPYNSFMGRANILLDPASSENNTSSDINGRVIVTELYGGSCGRGFENNITVDNPFYGYGRVVINGGTFKILPDANEQKNQLLCGIFGAGAGGMNGIGNDTNHTPDKRIPYWSTDGKVMLYGDYAAAKDKIIKYQCYNNDSHTTTEVDPLQTNTEIIINGGVFGSKTDSIDGIYGGGSGYMAPGLWTNDNAIPNVNGGNIYGKPGQTVSSLTINGGTFYCTNGIFAGGRGTDYYYAKKAYGARGETNGKDIEPTAKDYKTLGQIYGKVFGCRW